MSMSLRWRLAQKLEITWWKRYLASKTREDYLDWKKAYWRSFLDDLQPYMKVDSFQSAIDFGCGPAGIYIVLDQLEMTAVDPLLEKYEKSLSHFRPDDYPNVQFIPSSIEDHELTRSYDITFCINAINHVANMKKGFEQLASATRPGGYVCLTIDTHNYTLLKHLFRALPFVDALHPHQHNLREYEALVRQHNFDILSSKRLQKRMLFDYHLIIAKKMA